MSNLSPGHNFISDPAAELGAALSLVATATKLENLLESGPNRPEFNISQMFNGYDEFMRQAMVVAQKFEAWACDNIDFEALNDVWPYLLEDKFGDAFFNVVRLDVLAYNMIVPTSDETFIEVASLLKLKLKKVN